MTFDLNDGGGFCEPTATGSLPFNEPIKFHEAENLAGETGRQESQLTYWTGRKNTWGKRHGEPEEELKLKKIVTVMKSFGFTVAIDTPWPFH